MTWSVHFSVRDYECDLQGIVNNAVYQHYLEHARHQYLREQGVDFATLTAQGIHVVMTHAELSYKQPLQPGDQFEVTVAWVPQGRLRALFTQQIVRADGTLMLLAQITVAALDANGKPIPAMAILSAQ
jgi:acyl-CoA thioester hydrolase